MAALRAWMSFLEDQIRKSITTITTLQETDMGLFQQRQSIDDVSYFSLFPSYPMLESFYLIINIAAQLLHCLVFRDRDKTFEQKHLPLLMGDTFSSLQQT